MQVNFKKLYDNVPTPFKADSGAAGFDLTAMEVTNSNGIVTIKTGIATEIPVGYAGFLFPRSSIYKTGLSLANSVGVIDSSYRGEIMCKFRCLDDNNIYKVGDRCCQLVIMPVPDIILCEQSELSDTTRGSGGFGSSGK